MDEELRARPASAGAVVIEGPKACGKTASARQVAASAVLLDTDDQARRAAEIDASLVLDGPTPRLIDEWQLVVGIWNRRSLARNIATQATTTVLAADAGGGEGALHWRTVASCLTALERLMIVEDQPAWAPHLRSKANLGVVCQGDGTTLLPRPWDHLGP